MLHIAYYILKNKKGWLPGFLVYFKSSAFELSIKNIYDTNMIAIFKIITMSYNQEIHTIPSTIKEKVERPT